ncbi:3584_t:CDS:10 [Funneliformis geosporum]|uniref:3584_t:CDS:1 n=1 Tax=Funneliformis geosporum TaxID=1117311 RepID=A0A9W4WHR7_9GLOM|nr:3584_t:CDS:10 [Funneliformis geosporum]
MSQAAADATDRNVEIWKVKKLIKSLEAARGNGTSMISLIIPPKDQVSRIAKMLADEYGTASNIKSRVNRLSVLAAITSTQQRLKLYTKVPTNGLVVYCGTIVTEEGKEKKVNIDFEPFKPINTSLYLCDNKFHTEALSELLESDNKFGFIIMDGNGALFGTLSGNTREVIHKFAVELPKKHGRGGQSALRFARLREEKRHNYVRKVAELAVQFFVTNDKVNVTGLILAGSADFKTELSQSDMFDNRLQTKVIKLVDVSYGGENGFNQAIELAAESLANVKFIQEKKLIQKYFDEISQDTGKYCFGVDDTLKGLELGAVETLIVWENLDVTRFTLKNSSGIEIIVHVTKEQEKDRSHFIDKETNLEMEVADRIPLLEWFADHYKDFGANLEFVTNRSQEGSQFVKGFGGIGGLLRYKVDFDTLNYDSEEDGFLSARTLLWLGKLQNPSGSEKPRPGNGFPDTLPPTPFCQAVLEAQQSWLTQQKLATLTKLAKPPSRALAAITFVRHLV